MHRTEADNLNVVGGKNLHKDGPPGTTINAAIMNALQEEIATVVLGAGLSLKTAATDTWDQLLEAINALLAARLPAGTVIPYAGDTVPADYLECNGQNVSRSIYATLFANIATNFGQGDGSTTFTTPDLRGYVPRGWDNGAGNDPDAAGRTAQSAGGNTGDNVGSIQDHAQQGHQHAEPYYAAGGATAIWALEFWSGGTARDITTPSYQSLNQQPPTANGAYGTPLLSTENRMKNINLMYIIKT